MRGTPLCQAVNRTSSGRCPQEAHSVSEREISLQEVYQAVLLALAPGKGTEGRQEWTEGKLVSEVRLWKASLPAWGSLISRGFERLLSSHTARASQGRNPILILIHTR